MEVETVPVSAIDHQTGLKFLLEKQAASPPVQRQQAKPVAKSVDQVLVNAQKKIDAQKEAEKEGKLPTAAELVHVQEIRLGATMRKHLAAKLGSRYSPAKARLDTFIVNHPDQKPVVAQLREFAGNIRENIDQGVCLVLYGTAGTGKDHLQAAMLYEAAGAGITCNWMSGQKIFALARKAMNDGADDDRVVVDLTRAQVLAISDPAAPDAKLTDWQVQFLWRVVDERYQRDRPTWMTVNALELEELERLLSYPTFNRLEDRGGIFLKCCWPSARKRK